MPSVGTISISKSIFWFVSRVPPGIRILHIRTLLQRAS